MVTTKLSCKMVSSGCSVDHGKQRRRSEEQGSGLGVKEAWRRKGRTSWMVK